MAFLPRHPFQNMDHLGRNIDNFFTGFPAMFSNEGTGINVDVHETADKVIATCDIPGIENKDDINIDVNNNMLNINGTIQRSNDMKDENMHRKERFRGTFQRSITLPSPVSDEGVKASYKNGVLEVSMPKAQKDEKKQIDISFE